MLVFSHATVPIVFLILPLTRAAFLQPRQQLDWINGLCDEFLVDGLLAGV